MNIATTYDVLLMDKHGALNNHKLHLLSKNPGVIQLDGAASGNLHFSGPDAFDALKNMRMHLEGMGKVILCNGSRINVYPSPMSRSMGGGVMSYIHVIGEPAKQSNLVNIFEEAQLDQLGTVAQQAAFHEEWMNYFKERWNKS